MNAPDQEAINRAWAMDALSNACQTIRAHRYPSIDGLEKILAAVASYATSIDGMNGMGAVCNHLGEMRIACKYCHAVTAEQRQDVLREALAIPRSES